MLKFIDLTGGLVSPPYMLNCHSELVSEPQIEQIGLCHSEQQEQSAKRTGVTFYATA